MATENIYNHLAAMLANRETVAVATIIDDKGSVPREVGAKMIIHPLGRHVGTWDTEGFRSQNYPRSYRRRPRRQSG